MPAHDTECGARATLTRFPIHFSNSQFSRRRAPSPVFFVEAPGRPVFLPPPDARGWRARGRCRRRFDIRISLRRCGSASRRATRTSFNVRAHLRSFSSVRRNDGNGIPAPGRAFRFGAAGLTGRPCRSHGPLWVAFERQGFPASGKAPLPSASSWQAARIGHRAEPRRRPSAWEERSSPARGRRILLHHQTPHDDAPRSSRTHCE